MPVSDEVSVVDVVVVKVPGRREPTLGLKDSAEVVEGEPDEETQSLAQTVTVVANSVTVAVTVATDKVTVESTHEEELAAVRDEGSVPLTDGTGLPLVGRLAEGVAVPLGSSERLVNTPVPMKVVLLAVFTGTLLGPVPTTVGVEDDPVPECRAVLGGGTRGAVELPELTGTPLLTTVPEVAEIDVLTPVPTDKVELAEFTGTPLLGPVVTAPVGVAVPDREAPLIDTDSVEFTEGLGIVPLDAPVAVGGSARLSVPTRVEFADGLGIAPLEAPVAVGGSARLPVPTRVEFTDGLGIAPLEAPVLVAGSAKVSVPTRVEFADGLGATPLDAPVPVGGSAQLSVPTTRVELTEALGIAPLEAPVVNGGSAELPVPTNRVDEFDPAVP